jgi:hypothetical protein
LSSAKGRRVPPPRGLDFLIRNEQGRWAEELVIETINNETDFKAVRYGISRAVMVKSYNEWVKYWEKYQSVEKYGKRPNVLVFRKNTFREFEEKLKGYIKEYSDSSLIPEEIWEDYVRKSVCALEVEMSLWKASKMPDKDMKLPLRKTRNIIAPMIWVKEEDVSKLESWMKRHNKPIYAIQVFYDLAYIAPFQLIINKANRVKSARSKEMEREVMKREGLMIEKQKYRDEITGRTTTKIVYRLHPATTMLFGELIEPPKINVEVLEDKKGRIIPFLKFSDGKLKINPRVIEMWSSLASGRAKYVLQ